MRDKIFQAILDELVVRTDLSWEDVSFLKDSTSLRDFLKRAENLTDQTTLNEAMYYGLLNLLEVQNAG